MGGRSYTGRRQIIDPQPDVEVADFITHTGHRLDHLDARPPQRDNQIEARPTRLPLRHSGR